LVQRQQEPHREERKRRLARGVGQLAVAVAPAPQALAADRERPVADLARQVVQSEVRQVPERPVVATPDELLAAAAGRHAPEILLQRAAQRVGPAPPAAEFGQPEGPASDAVLALEPRAAR
jgi:hypothetical protein